MRNGMRVGLLALGCIFGLAGSARADRPGVVWYRHPLKGGAESGDWLGLSRSGSRISGWWLHYMVAPSGRPTVDLRPVEAKQWDGGGWLVPGSAYRPGHSFPVAGKPLRGAWLVQSCGWEAGHSFPVVYVWWGGVLGARSIRWENTVWPKTGPPTTVQFDRAATAPRFLFTHRALLKQVAEQEAGG